MAAKATVAEATKKLQADQAAAVPVQTKVATAKQAFDQSRASLDQLKQEVDGLRQQASVSAVPAVQG